mgnify:CR=1 FL=1
MRKTGTLLVLLLAITTACKKDIPQGFWIKGNEKEQLKTIETQFRGFDKTMVEVGYRYTELYWSGQDQNWDYAKYQLQKIDKSIRLGLQRRSKRAKSATHFLTYVIPEMNKAIKSKDTAKFNKSFGMLRSNCISCHAMEKKPSFVIQIPTNRLSPIGI